MKGPLFSFLTFLLIFQLLMLPTVTIYISASRTTMYMAQFKSMTQTGKESQRNSKILEIRSCFGHGQGQKYSTVLTKLHSKDVRQAS